MATPVYAIEIPLSTVQGTTASYVIPVDRYAWVSAALNGTGTFLVNGNVVLVSSDSTWNALSASALDYGHFTSGVTVGNDKNSLYVGTSGIAESTTTGRAFSAETAHSVTSAQARFKLATGDVISGTGTCKYHVELYRIPGALT